MEFKLEEEKEFVDKLLSQSTVLNFEKGDFVYHAQSQPKGLYYVEQGLVGLIYFTAKGQESLLRLFKVGQFHGHRSLFSDEPYHASARCLEKCTLRFCSKSQVFELFDKEPKAYFFLARALAKELRRAEVRSVLISEGDVIERVSATLLFFKNLYPEHRWTRSEIAHFCASRTPTVIKALGQLEAQGIIQQKGHKIEILKPEQLLEFIE